MRKEVGQVEVLVNNAGILHGGALLKLSEEDIRRTFDVNILAYIWVCDGILNGKVTSVKLLAFPVVLSSH